jgi:hypothetical protein
MEQRGSGVAMNSTQTRSAVLQVVPSALETEPAGGRMDPFGRGIVAGFAATLVVSLIHDPIAMVLVAPTAGIGWLFHFFVGSLIWGGGFGLLHDRLYGPSWLRGLTFSLGAAMLVMTTVLPAVGAGFFGWRFGPAAPVVIIAIHLVYGAVLGAIYGLTDGPPENLARERAEIFR